MTWPGHCSTVCGHETHKEKNQKEKRKKEEEEQRDERMEERRRMKERKAYNYKEGFSQGLGKKQA